MHAALVLGLLAFGFCLAFTPLCRALYLRLGFVDRPDAVRKLHKGPVPRAGGPAIALAYVSALGLLLLVSPEHARLSVQHKGLLLSLLPAACLVFLTGLADDLLDLRARTKLAGQAVAAVLAVTLGARITLVGGHPVADWISIPLSIFWLLACTNALNLIDGLDGLAGGVGLFATLSTLLAALLQGNTGLAMATVPLAACLLAFLRYNFNPASVFLGDSGSLTVGFLLGCFGLIWSQKSATFLGMAAPMMALALPLIDCSVAIGRRYLSKRPIFGADRGHVHHRLLALGLHPRKVALMLYGVCGVFAGLSLLQCVVQARFQGLIVVLFGCLAVFGVNRLRYAEFSVCRELLSRRTVLRMLQERAFLENFESMLRAAGTPEGRWKVIADACAALHFSSVQMELDGRLFANAPCLVDTAPALTVTAALGDRGTLYLTRPGGAPASSWTMHAVDRMLHALRDQLPGKQWLPAEEHVEETAFSRTAT